MTKDFVSKGVKLDHVIYFKIQILWVPLSWKQNIFIKTSYHLNFLLSLYFPSFLSLSFSLTIYFWSRRRQTYKLTLVCMLVCTSVCLSRFYLDNGSLIFSETLQLDRALGVLKKCSKRIFGKNSKIGHFWPKSVKKWPSLPKIQFFEGFWLLTSIFVISFGLKLPKVFSWVSSSVCG